MKILGFSPEGEPILPPTSSSTDPDVIRHEKLAWEDISVQAAKIVSFIGSLGTFSVAFWLSADARADLAGHERYLKTTLYGLTSGAPSLVLLMVGANAGLIGMSKEHLAIALALNVPVAVCITKAGASLRSCASVTSGPLCRST